MEPDQLQFVRRLHHEVGSVPGSKVVWNQARDIVRLINIIHSEDRRADAAESRLKAILTKAAEENLESLLAGPASFTAAGGVIARKS